MLKLMSIVNIVHVFILFLGPYNTEEGYLHHNLKPGPIVLGQEAWFYKFYTGCEAVKKEGRTQMHNVTKKGFNKGPDRQYINKTMEHKTQDYGGGVTGNNEQTNR